MNRDYYTIEKAINFIEANFKSKPSLDEIAASVNLSPFHFERLFKKWAGITPKQFVRALSIEYTKEVLENSKSVFEASFEAGHSSTSRIHDLFINIEAVTPKEFKTKGEGLEIFYGFHETIFGRCLIAVTNKGICALRFTGYDYQRKSNDDQGDMINHVSTKDSKNVETRFIASKDVSEKESSSETQDFASLQELRNDWPNAKFIQDQNKTKEYIDLIFSKDRNKPVNIFLKGTNFQIQVWRALLTIPKSNLVTYEALAQSINNPKALRAVGTAVGKNPISFLIPCHRVINKTGILGNYRWGRARKKAMLGYELNAISN